MARRAESASVLMTDTAKTVTLQNSLLGCCSALSVALTLYLAVLPLAFYSGLRFYSSMGDLLASIKG